MTSPALEKPTPLPWRPLIVLLLLNTVQPLAFEIIFPFVNQMILEIGVVNDPEQVGFYSGFTESIFACLSFITILPISLISDRVGRKPVILVCVLGIAVSVVSFGMSTSFLAMVLSRCIGGVLGGSEGAMRIMVGEMTDKSNQGTAFSGLAISYRIGQIVGLPLGGSLVHPARNFSLFRSRFWYDYPYALPCFVAAAFAVAGDVLAFFWLEETLPSLRRKLEPATLIEDTTPLLANPDTTSSPETLTTTENPAPSSLKSVLTPSIISLLASNVAMCFVSETLFSVYPLFAFTPVHSGGLGASEAVIGAQLSVRAILHIAVLFFFAPLEKRLGVVRLYQLTMMLYPATVACYPLLHWLVPEPGESSWGFNLALFAAFVAWSFGAFSWTAINIMVNDAAPSAAALATINGVSQMAMVLPQAVAPAFVTSLFAASIKSQIANGNLVWIVLFAIACCAAAHSLTLREPTVDWRKDVSAEQPSAQGLLPPNEC